MVDIAGRAVVAIRSQAQPPDFDGSEAGWKEWMFAFESFAGLHEFDGLLYSELSAGAWTDGLRERTRLLYHLLVGVMRGKAASIV